MQLDIIAKAVNGTLEGKSLQFTKLSTDSRQIAPDSLFIALQGENFDGHRFIAQAIQNGANAVIAERAKSPNIPPQVSVIWVENTIQALGKLANLWRNQFDIPMIGITGSCGKTTVKTMLGSILAQVGNTLVPQSSFNNQFGLPFSLLKLNTSHRYAVLELGTNGFGEIKQLTSILSPTHAMITNVRPAHLAGLKTVENIAKEKGAIYEGLRVNGTAIINQDEPYFNDWRKSLNQQSLVTFGLQRGDIHAEQVTQSIEQSRFMLNTPNGRIEIILPAPGVHNVMNALSAAAAAVSLGVALEVIQAGLRAFQGVSGRLRKLQSSRGACVIDDCYNANPASFKAAIDVLSQASGEKILVMGDMGELGSESERFHQEIGGYAKAKGIDQIYAVGRFSAFAGKAFGKGAIVFENKQALVNALTPKLNAETTVLVKGSRSAKMEDILTAIVP